jgi:predicted protein tyrosine phosphatase
VSAIIVCPLSRLSETVERSGARHVVTLISQMTLVTRPAPIEVANHLFIGINDICEPAEGLVCPAAGHVSELLSFVERWDRRAPMIVHCYAGISRSTAAAFSALCALRPDIDEAVIAGRLRSRSAQATPNALIVSLADEILGRDGRMIRAVEAIGRGAEAPEGTIFSLRLDE